MSNLTLYVCIHFNKYLLRISNMLTPELDSWDAVGNKTDTFLYSVTWAWLCEQQPLTIVNAVSIKGKSGVPCEDILSEPKAEVTREPALRR